jgi:di/tricarboxylate transporter
MKVVVTVSAAALLAVAVIAAQAPAPAQPAAGPGAWRSFEGSLSASGERQTRPTESGRPASTVRSSGPVAFTSGEGLSRGFRVEVIGFDDGAGLIWFVPPPDGLTVPAWRLFALFAVFLEVGVKLGVPAAPLAFMLLFASNFFSVITPQGSSANLLFTGSGYLSQGELYRLGAITTGISLLYLVVGTPWLLAVAR